MYYMVEKFFKEGGKVMDFLRGSEEYKTLWTEQSTTNIRLCASRRGFRGVLRHLIWFKLMPFLDERARLLHNTLIVVSEEGMRGCLARVGRRLWR